MTAASDARVRVLVRYAARDADPGAVAEAYSRVCAQLRGTSGLLGSELLGSTLDPGRFAVLSEWRSLEEFRRWEQGPAHKGQTAGLRAFRDDSGGRGYDIYEVMESL
ncbi:antibiotic biosynthesis monooxygenase family protein [Actinomadura algeriensis]|uniref:Heme-degrading monooxygenase HmoA n=1 Tax=Actinomadura algeriensis TaxID=1679523 RepID=A0ABR9JJB5_9ACTN|nr:antibiotic biosynthesis monooxygenase family protein [Actinomadura algeriensis]MBE1530523.1 heme-degrading monooxygenase HmoA [Actinomadura algeriensis]